MKTKDSNLYITLSKSFLAKTSAEANKRAMKSFTGEKDEGKDTLYYDTTEMVLNDETEVEYDVARDTLDIRISSDLGYFSWSIPVNLDLKIAIIESVTKQFNKVKSMLESAK